MAKEEKDLRNQQEEQGKQEKEYGNKKRMISIKTKLLGIIIPVVALLVLLLVTLSYSISRDIIEKSSRDLLKSSVENQANKIESWLDANLAAFQIVKTTIEGMQPTNEQIQTILDQYYGYNNNYPNGLYLADEDGNYYKASESTQTEDDSLNTTWYKQGLSRVNMGFGTAYKDGEGNSIISASGIVDDNSGKIKILSVDLSLQKISIIVNSYINMNDAQAFLVDTSDGTILAHRDYSLISTILSSNSQDKFLMQVSEKLQVRDYSTSELGENMIAFEKIQGTDWILASYVPTKTVMGELNNLRTIMLIIGIVSVVMLSVLIERVVHVVIKPVKLLTQSIVAMTGGDFTIDVKTKGNDEISVMSDSVRVFISSMRNMISDMNSISEQLNMQSESSKSISQEMYHVSKIQSESMSDLNSTVDQLAISVNEVAENAVTLATVVAETRDDSVIVNNKMQETVEVSEKGKADMEKVSVAMNAIRDSIHKLEAAINRVGSASIEITNIVDAIGDIAEQTNLLSLNASIEAARAGTAGRGFAVVASEIGNLAKTSSDSVQNISKLTTEINRLINDAVNQSGDTVKNIGESSELIRTAIDSINIIFENINITDNLVAGMVTKVGKVDEVATTVAAISEEQAASTEEILSTSENMVYQATNITKNSEEVANESNELALTSEKLADQVKMFKI
ncbi:MAG: methyl-accepting chemotaxis protein [Mobilitalea sp.]